VAEKLLRRLPLLLVDEGDHVGRRDGEGGDLTRAGDERHGDGQELLDEGQEVHGDVSTV
jgi:hypothetical protein